MNPVSAVNNPQLEQYALGVLAGLARENYPKKFEMVIVQPKLKMKGLPVVSTWTITTEDLLKLVPVIVAQAAATEAPTPRWCLARPSVNIARRRVHVVQSPGKLWKESAQCSVR
jgi:hypothetical protein